MIQTKPQHEIAVTNEGGKNRKHEFFRRNPSGGKRNPEKVKSELAKHVKTELNSRQRKAVKKKALRRKTREKTLAWRATGYV